MAVVAQRNFAGGELAPSLYAHTDLEKYSTGLRKCRNFVVQRHGGVSNRAGTEYVAEVKDSTKTVRLVRFHFNDDQTYVMEFGDQYIRWHQDGAPILFSAPAAWALATGYSIGDRVAHGGSNYYAFVGHTSAALTEPGVGANWTTVWKALSGFIHEIPTPYLEADLMRLQFVQSADVVTIVHQSYAPRDLRRLATTNWTLTTITFGPAIASPTNFTRTGGGLVSADVTRWGITAVSSATGEESLVATYQANFIGDAANAVAFSWTAVSGASEYRLYREVGSISYAGYTGTGTYGLIGSTSGTTFSDTNTAANFAMAPPRDLLNVAFGSDFPAAVTYYQQRLLLGNTPLHPETVYGSRVDDFNTFVASTPLQDDHAIEFTMIGRQVNEVRHMLDLGRLVVFTSSEEKMVEGDEAGILRPDAVNVRKISSNGSEWLAPVEINDSAVYLQSRGTIVRDLSPVNGSSYEGTDLTVFAAHLFRNYTISDWDYAQNPDSVLWAVRSDGKMVALTYMTDQTIWGWHWHDTDGTFERVVSVPEGDQDSVYFVVKRTINGSVKRYIERLAVRDVSDVDDLIFLDCCSTYDGWNVAATTMTISGGTTWAYDETLTLTASANTFVAGDVGNVFIIVLEDSDGVETDRIRFTVDTFSSATVVTGRPDKTVPAGLQGVARATWARAIKSVTGLTHLAGEDVSVFADGYVVASPNNSAYPVLTVSGAGVLTLAQPYAVINVGLPYIADLETLDLDTPGRTSIKNRRLLVNKVGVYTESSRGIFAGQPEQPTTADPLNGLQEYRSRDDEDYGDPNDLRSEYHEVATEGNWNNNGRVLIRQVDPLPLTVLAVMPIGYLPTDG